MSIRDKLKPEVSPLHQCSHCDRNAVHHFGSTCMCRRCYEDKRERTEVDTRVAEWWAANPQMQRFEDETRVEYGKRMKMAFKRGWREYCKDGA